MLATLGLRDRELLRTQEELKEQLEELEEQLDEVRPGQELDKAEFRQSEEQVIDVSTSSEDSLFDYLHDLEYDEGVSGLLEKLNSLGIETKGEFLERLHWHVEVPEEQIPEYLFAVHIWKEVLNKSEATDYQELWDKELSQSFLVVKIQDNAYFLKRNHG